MFAQFENIKLNLWQPYFIEPKPVLIKNFKSHLKYEKLIRIIQSNSSFITEIEPDVKKITLLNYS